MNTSSRSRNGIHSLNRNLGRRCWRCATTMLNGARRPRQSGEILVVCRLLEHCLRLGQRMAQRDPHLLGPRARDDLLDTLRLEQREKEMDAALEKVSGPPPPGEPKPVSTLWTDRHEPPPKQRRRFLKWFHQHCPSP